MTGIAPDSVLMHELGRLCRRRWPYPPGVLAELRRWYWIFVRRYAFEVCNRCGRPVGRCTDSWWSADDELWMTVNGGFAGVMCPPCFTRACRARGIHVYWRPIIDV